MALHEVFAQPSEHLGWWRLGPERVSKTTVALGPRHRSHFEESGHRTRKINFLSQAVASERAIVHCFESGRALIGNRCQLKYCAARDGGAGEKRISVFVEVSAVTSSA